MNDAVPVDPSELTSNDALPEVELVETPAEPISEPVLETAPVPDFGIDLDDTLVLDETNGQLDGKVVPTRSLDTFTPQATVTQNHPTFEKAHNKIFDTLPPLELLNVGAEQITDLLKELDIPLNGREPLDPDRERVRTLINGIGMTLLTSYYQKSLERPTADWRQELDVGGTPLRAAKAMLRSTDDPVLRVRNELGLGGLVQVPLWHSGIWLTLRTPSDRALLELEQRISADKIAFGRQSNGRIFSNTNVYTMAHLVEFVLDHLHHATVANWTPELLRKLIRTTDIPTMVWGTLVSIYPKGYQIRQPCLANPTTCHHEVQQLINLGRIHWVDTTALNDRQRKHMSNRLAMHTEEQVLDYQKEFSFGVKDTIALSKGVRVRLAVPSLQQQIDAGHRWVDNILQSTQKAFAHSMTEREREQYIQAQAQVTSLREYSHWVAGVTYEGRGEEELLDSPTVLESIVEHFCASPEHTKTLYQAIGDYIDGSSIAMVAIPRETCPACQGEPQAEYLRHPQLIPLDVVAVFFILRVLRLAAMTLG